MNPDHTASATADPIAEIHEIRRRLAAEHGDDPRRLGEFLRQRGSQRSTNLVRVEKKLVRVPAA